MSETETKMLAAAFVQALPDAAIIIDSSGLILASNAQWADITGFKGEGMHLSAATRAPAVLEAARAALDASSRSRVAFEVRVPTPRRFEAHVAPLGLGRERAALIVLRDLTREQQIERMRADFVANASHELRTPLAALSGFIETLQGAARHDEAARERFLGLMQAQAGRMKRLIDDLLSLSRIEINEHVAPSEAVDLGLVAQTVRSGLAFMAAETGCEIRLALEAGLMVTGDREELVQVVQNLTENALKYAGSGKTVEILGAKSGGAVELAVQDHGPGIAEEHIPRLTERFYRVSVQDSRQRGGTGLGLAIVKHIVSRHRGRLLITSEPGAGSRFAIRLPERK